MKFSYTLVPVTSVSISATITAPQPEPRRVYRARGRVFKVGRTWHYEVSDASGVVRLADNTGDWRTILDACMRDVAVLNRILGAGHLLKHSYAELVDRATSL